MMPDVVVDIGNTRYKWGRCLHGKITDMIGLGEDPSTWRAHIEQWQLPAGAIWLLASVHPDRRDRLAAWLLEQGMVVRVLASNEELPIEIRVDEPARVGIDRLLNAIGARGQMSDGRGAIIVDAGTAITVDVVDEEGAFLGGAILPGLRLMAAALHDHTAKLPLVEVRQLVAPEPGRNTHDAIAVGVCWAVLGGVRELIAEFVHDPANPPHIYLTGGDADFLRPVHPDAVVWPDLTLEGILASAEALR